MDRFSHQAILLSQILPMFLLGLEVYWEALCSSGRLRKVAPSKPIETNEFRRA